MTKKQLYYLGGVVIILLTLGFLSISLLGSRNVEVIVKNDLNSAPVGGVSVDVIQNISSTSTVNHQIISTESKNINFDDNHIMTFSSNDYKPLTLKYIDIEYLDLIGTTLYTSTPTIRKITGRIRDFRNQAAPITIECDKCIITSEIFSNKYSFEIDTVNYTPPITLTYRLGPTKEIILELTPPSDGHATIDIAFDDSSTKGNALKKVFKWIKNWFKAL